MTAPDAATELDAAIAAGDGTLHGAIDYWQERAERAEAERDALKGLLRQVRPHIMTATYLAEGRLDNEDESEPYFTLQELLASIDAAMEPK